VNGASRVEAANVSISLSIIEVAKTSSGSGSGSGCRNVAEALVINGRQLDHCWASQSLHIKLEACSTFPRPVSIV